MLAASAFLLSRAIFRFIGMMAAILLFSRRANVALRIPTLIIRCVAVV